MKGYLKVSTGKTIVVLMVDETDHVTGLAGLTLSISASKNGSAFSSISPSVTDRGNGKYAIDLTTTHTNTQGVLWLEITAAGADDLDVWYEVGAIDPQDSVRLGLTALPNVAPGFSGGLITLGSGTGQITTDGAGLISADVVAVSGDSAAADALESHLDSDTGAWDGGGGGAGAAPPLGQFRHVASDSILVFDFFVQKMLVDSTETDPKVGKTGLTEANFTVKSCLGESTSFTTIADAGHAIIELGGGYYRLTASAAADYTDEDGEAVVAIYTVTDLSGGAETGLVWTERYVVGTAAAAVYGLANGASVIEGSYTRDDILRLITGVICGTVADFETDTQAYKSLNGAKTRLIVTTDTSGRVAIVVGDLT